MGVTLVVGEPDVLTRDLVAAFQKSARRAIEARGRFTVALAGGSIAPAFFPTLAALPIDWARVHFFWADERAVPPDDPESNYAAARTWWLDPAGVPSDNIHRPRADAADLEQAARDYAAVLEDVAGRPPALDFVLLGAGPDGHIASLFPGHPLLQERSALIAVVTDSPKPPSRRLTLTFGALCRSGQIVVAATGESKAQGIRDSLQPGSALPLAQLIGCAKGVRLLLDKAAAALLPRG